MVFHSVAILKATVSVGTQLFFDVIHLASSDFLLFLWSIKMCSAGFFKKISGAVLYLVQTWLP
jgi:hypothetical protein